MQKDKNSPSHKIPMWIVWVGIALCILISFLAMVLLDFTTKEASLKSSEANTTQKEANATTKAKKEEEKQEENSTILNQKANMRLRLNNLSEELSHMGVDGDSKTGSNAAFKEALQKQEAAIKRAQESLELQSKD